MEKVNGGILRVVLALMALGTALVIGAAAAASK